MHRQNNKDGITISILISLLCIKMNQKKEATMQNIQSIMETLSAWVWGPYMLILLIGTGVFHTFRLMFLQFRLLPFAFVVIMVFSALVILGGIKSIAKAATFIVPIMAIGYVLGGLAIILTNLNLVIPALKLIFVDAFTGQAVAGGAIGTVIRYGVARSVFSNEVGIGSAPLLPQQLKQITLFVKV